MKKLSLIILLIFTLFLSGCGGSKTKKMECTLEKEADFKLTAKYTVEYEGKYVKSIRFYEEYISDDKDTLDTIQKQVETIYNGVNEKYGGYTIDIKNDGNKVVADVIVNYNKFNISLWAKDNSSLNSFVEDGKILLSAIKKQYDSAGLTCK